ncbi:MAG: xanthine dehydrogenase family protein subunit M [Chloroflexi bacterium]|nr:xanthine dehydrogenase family protein subunit M [Chloroflexota bacterium]
MKPAPFKYHAPRSVDEAVELLAQYGYDAKVLAGGQSLIPTMNFRLAQPAVLIDLNAIPDLAYISPTRDGGLRLGAMTRHATVERDPQVAQIAPLVSAAMPLIAHPAIRNRGTFGGSIAHADPASELPAVIRALAARVVARSQRGERTIEAKDFFLGVFTTALEPDEMVVEVRIPPMPRNSGWSVREVARRHGDFALVGAAAWVQLNGGGRCSDARLAFFGVGDGPVLAEKAAALLAGQTPDDDLIQAAADLAAREEVDPSSDIHATAEFRRHLVRVLARQALSEAFQRAGQGG